MRSHVGCRCGSGICRGADGYFIRRQRRGTSSGYNKTTLADLSDQLSLISYSQYLENHAGVSAGAKEIVINAADYDEKATTAKNITKESGVYGLEDEVVLTDEPER